MSREGLLYIGPKPGNLLRLEDGSLCPETGKWVHPTQYVLRRLRKGDAVKLPPPKPPKADGKTKTK